jgi:hypothetical protein
VRLPKVQQHLDERDGKDRSMIDDFSLPLDRQYQQNLTEWAVKCAMCNDTVDPGRPRCRCPPSSALPTTATFESASRTGHLLLTPKPKAKRSPDRP